MKFSYLILAFAIITNSLANVLIKAGMNRVGGLSFSSLHDIIHKFVLNWTIWIGIFLFGVTLIAYAKVITMMNLSIAYPIMTSLGFIIVTLISVHFFHEKLDLIQLIGMGVIILGVWMVAR